jgi:hypothetical protein
MTSSAKSICLATLFVLYKVVLAGDEIAPCELKNQNIFCEKESKKKNDSGVFYYSYSLTTLKTLDLQQKTTTLPALSSTNDYFENGTSTPYQDSKSNTFGSILQRTLDNVPTPGVYREEIKSTADGRSYTKVSLPSGTSYCVWNKVSRSDIINQKTSNCPR